MGKKLWGEKVRLARIRAGLKQSELAEQLKVSTRTILRIENGETDVGLPRLEQLATLLNVPVTFFITDTETPTAGNISVMQAEQELSRDAGVTVNLKASMDVFQKELTPEDIEKIKNILKALRESGETGHIGLTVDLTKSDDDL